MRQDGVIDLRGAGHFERAFLIAEADGRVRPNIAQGLWGGISAAVRVVEPSPAAAASALVDLYLHGREQAVDGGAVAPAGAVASIADNTVVEIARFRPWAERAAALPAASDSSGFPGAATAVVVDAVDATTASTPLPVRARLWVLPAAEDTPGPVVHGGTTLGATAADALGQARRNRQDNPFAPKRLALCAVALTGPHAGVATATAGTTGAGDRGV